MYALNYKCIIRKLVLVVILCTELMVLFQSEEKMVLIVHGGAGNNKPKNKELSKLAEVLSDH